MAFAQGSRSQLAIGALETSFTAAAGAVTTSLPFNTHSLNLTKDRVAGNEIQPDRMDRVDRHGNKSVGGDIVVDLRDTTYDLLIQSALMNATDLSTGVGIGTTPQYFSIEDQFLDLAAPNSRNFSKMTVSSMGVSIAPNQMVTTTFGLVGKDMTLTNTPTSVPIVDAEPVPFDSYNGSISVGGSVVSVVTSLDFTLTNSFAPTFVVGSDSAAALEFGKAVVEGTLTAYVDDLSASSLANLFSAETESSISVTVAEGTTAGDANMTFLIPRVKFNSADIPVDGPTSRIVNLSFVGLYDAGEDTNFKVTAGTV